RLGLGLTGVTELPCQRRILASATVLDTGLAAFQAAPVGDGLVGAVLEVADQGGRLLQGMENVATTGNVGQRLRLTGPQPTGEIGDGTVGAEAPLLQLQQTHAPGSSVAVILGAEQVAVGRSDVGPDQHGAACLEDLVVGTDADTGEVLLVVDTERGSHGLMQDVMDSPDG